MLSEVACVVNYWSSSSSSSDDCWDAFSSFSCDMEVQKKKKGWSSFSYTHKENAFQVASTRQPVIHVSAGFI